VTHDATAASRDEHVMDAAVVVEHPGLTVDIALTASRGDIVGLVGANGSGKTTVLRALAGLRPIDRGRIVIGGATLDDPVTNTFVPPQLRNVALVFQDYRLFSNMTARDNIAYGLRHRSKLSRREAQERATEWLDRFDLSTHSDHHPGALSGGQSQRVALARALATEPDVLLLDEPLAAIDPMSRRLIRADLARYLSAFDGVTVMVSHDRDDISALATHALALSQGRVAWGGHPEDVPEIS
jgi:molybdate transport system ATP-binding protein